MKSRAAYVLIALAVLVVGLVAAGCGSKIEGVPSTVATVNGEEISAEQYLSQLNRTAGRDVLRGMIEQQLMVQWARDQKVPPTDAQINSQIDALKRDGEYEDRVEVLSEAGLRQQLEVEQAVVNLAKKFYKIEDTDLEAAYTMAESNYVHPPRKRVEVILVPDKAKAEEAAEKAKKTEDFDEVASEFVPGSPFGGPSGPIKMWLDPDDENLPPPLAEAVQKTEIGKVSGVFALGEGDAGQYGVLKVVAEQPKSDLKLDDVKPEIEKIAAMQKVQANSTDFQKRLNDWKKKAEIDVNIGQFKGITSAFKSPPEPMAPPTQMMPEPAPEPQPESGGEGDAGN